MISNNLQPIGYQALIKLYNLRVVPHYRASYISFTGGKQFYIKNNQEIHIYPKDYQLARPEDPFLNLEFALKHEGMNFSIIKFVLDQLTQEKVTTYIMATPQGKIERKIWYLYEFLLDQQLPLKDVKGGNYIDLLDPKKYYVTQALKIKRQRINDNLLGFSHFCPFVRRTATLDAFEKAHFDDIAKKLLADYEPLITQRAASYLYTKETLSSWHIEHEEPTKMRAINFVKLLKQAAELMTLNKKELIHAQHVIVEPRFAELDYRHSQNYVAESPRPGYSIIHYISPRPEDVPSLMNDLLLSLERMINSKVHPVIIASCISFGFVFIHPFEDGNGRLHRFLIQYILARTGFAPKGIIFPVSATMLNELKKYDQMLESFSRPLMNLLIYDENRSGQITAENNDVAYYAFIDYTVFAEYLFACIQKTIQSDLRKELAFIVEYDRIKKAIQEIVDMPDNQRDLLIKMLAQNKGKLSPTKRKKFFSALTDAEINTIEEITKDFSY